jgi:hypothetical protein
LLDVDWKRWFRIKIAIWRLRRLIAAATQLYVSYISGMHNHAFIEPMLPTSRYSSFVDCPTGARTYVTIMMDV